VKENLTEIATIVAAALGIVLAAIGMGAVFGTWLGFTVAVAVKIFKAFA
jgi:uncharacterized membrane protein (Fun14 family)